MQGYSSVWAPTKHSVAHVQEPEIDGLAIRGVGFKGVWVSEFRGLGVIGFIYIYRNLSGSSY